MKSCPTNNERIHHPTSHLIHRAKRFATLLSALLCAATLISTLNGSTIEREIEPDELVDALIRYEASFYGQTVQTNWARFIGPGSTHQIWFSDDGQVQVSEYSIVMKRDQEGKAQVVEQLGAYHDNADFSLQAMQRIIDGTPGEVSLNAVPGRSPRGIGTEYHAVLFGYSSLDRQRFSEICADGAAELSVATFRFKGEELVGLNCSIPRKGKYVFGFIRDGEQYRLRYWHVSKGVGDSFTVNEGVFHLVAGNELPEMVAAGWSNVTEQIYTWYPIEYDGDFPVKASIWNFDRDAPGETVSEILYHSDSDRDLEPDIIQFSNIDVPRSGEVRVHLYRSGVPTVLKNGRLVSVIDGQALEQMTGVGYRSPPRWVGSWSFFFLTGGILLIVLGGSYLWWVRHQRSR